jgi:pyruvate/2-oxoglutarate dehydrogenase complex dihydrolipoamide acyltransferase (E2) component
VEIIRTTAKQGKHTETYIRLCLRAAQRAESKAEAMAALQQPVESHHVVPRSFGLGGEKCPSNLVHLSLREHLVAHRLLAKMFTGKLHRSMRFALWRMCNSGGYRISSRTYEAARQGYLFEAALRAHRQWSDPGARERLRVSARARALLPENMDRSKAAGMRAMKCPAARQRISQFARGRISVYNSGTGVERRIIPADLAEYEANGYVKGRGPRRTEPPPVSAETRKKISEARKGKPRPDCRGKRGPLSPEIRRKISESKKGRPMSLETRQRLSQSMKAVHSSKRAA